MSRVCRVCRADGLERLMKDELRHLHELERGDRFVFPSGGEVRMLRKVTSCRALVSVDEDGEQVQFEAGGREVSFQRSGSGTKPCAPRAEVVPLREVTA